MSHHILDRPAWDALRFAHAKFAIGTSHALRYRPSVGPIAATQDEGVESLKQLAELIRSTGVLVLLQKDPVIIPDQTKIVRSKEGVQMILDRLILPSQKLGAEIEPLTTADIPSMVALAALTQPGPFENETSQLGQFWGVKENGRLLAMAGERMKQMGYSEVSGVCAHPDARGRGYAKHLSAFVANRIVARGETPYLHSFAANEPAVRLYESLGFRVRCPVNIVVLDRA